MAGKIFFSYARSDGAFTLDLARRLRDEGLDIWIDQLDIPSGARWDRAVEQALREAPVVLLILTSSSIASVNVLDDVKHSRSRNLQGQRLGDFRYAWKCQRMV